LPVQQHAPKPDTPPTHQRPLAAHRWLAHYDSSNKTHQRFPRELVRPARSTRRRQESELVRHGWWGTLCDFRDHRAAGTVGHRSWQARDRYQMMRGYLSNVATDIGRELAHGIEPKAFFDRPHSRCRGGSRPSEGRTDQLFFFSFDLLFLNGVSTAQLPLIQAQGMAATPVGGRKVRRSPSPPAAQMATSPRFASESYSLHIVRW
jgi:hypothetical protein